MKYNLSNWQGGPDCEWRRPLGDGPRVLQINVPVVLVELVIGMRLGAVDVVVAKIVVAVVAAVDGSTFKLKKIALS